MELTINIKKEKKINFILELLKSFDYVDILNNSEFTPEQQLEIDRRLELLEKGESKLYSWDEVKNEIQGI